MSATIALLEVLDRDGHVRHNLPITDWPASVGRALDNQLVLDDAHVAAHHFTIDADAAGAFIQVGETINGLRANGRHHGAAERFPVGPQSMRLDVGDSHLCLRLAEHALAPEQPLNTPRTLWHHVGLPLVAGIVVLVTLLFATWLDTDPDDLSRTVGGMLMTALIAGLAWCAGWALLSKIFTRRSHFWWHVRVLLLAVIALEVVDTLAHLLGFAMSWPWISDFGFVARYAVIAAMLYFHLLGIEPRRRTRLRVVAVTAFLVGTASSLWFNQQARDQFGDELYMNHLFPPALRVARPLETAQFVKGLAPLQAVLDEKAKKRDSGDAPTGSSDEE
ncbi:MAG: hypothetical protein E6H58_05925 [Betaproteobacteria bacterium]|nr:MAG: hypothetical protein E6H65_07350 [Betaproteobacteria bacterium]TMH34600.1 MAG: hypothetical protein E6H58_05925 [Betaproteobacteria bacterium]